MTEQKIDDTQLHRYYDGDLSPEEASEVQAALAEDKALADKFGALEELGDMLRSHAKVQAQDLDSDALFAAIEAGLDEDRGQKEESEPVSTPRLRVIEGSGKDTPAPAPAVSRGPLYVMVAIAAAALLLFMWEPAEDTQVAQTPVAPIAPAPEEPPENVVIETAPSGSEVLAVDFGSNTGTSFSVEGAHGQPVAVLWISDEESTLQ